MPEKYGKKQKIPELVPNFIFFHFIFSITSLVGTADDPSAAVLVGEAEALRIHLVQAHPTSLASSSPPPAPALPPLREKAFASTLISTWHDGKGRPAGAKSAAARGGGGGYSAPEPLRRLVEVYENQRRLTVLRPFSVDDLLPLDIGGWSDEAHKVSYAGLEAMPLPSADWR